MALVLVNKAMTKASRWGEKGIWDVRFVISGGVLYSGWFLQIDVREVKTMDLHCFAYASEDSR